MSHSKRTLSALVALIGFAALPVLAADDGHFSLSVGSHDNLVISDPSGQPIADVPGQTVAQDIALGSITLQVSFGRDANGQLTAILTAPDQDSLALHFSAGGKTIDAEKAVVTLTFSPDLKGVLVDPGYVGTVEVDSHVLRARSLADDLPIPAALADAPSDVVMPNLPPSSVTPPAANTASATPETPVTPDATVVQNTPAPSSGGQTASSSDTTASTGTASLAANAATPQPAPAAGSDMPITPAPLASQLAPILPPVANAASNTPADTTHYQSVQQRLVDTMAPIAPGATTMQKLYWSEPITAPDGSAPSVAMDEIRLVEVHGTVTIVAPGGAEQTGTEGTLVPSGATVRAAANSSAALFMGGVNSARLMPGCELVVTQTLAGPVRTDVINLKAGAVFSRIGHRDGETENYSVVTPEGVTGAESNDMLAFRGTPDDLGANPVTSAKLDLNSKYLLAWDPAPAHGLISDVPGWDLGSIDTGKKNNNSNTYFYYCQSGSAVQSNDIRQEVLTCDNHGGDKGDGNNSGKDGSDGGKDGGNNFGNGGDNHHQSDCKPQYVLQQILETLQPYNCKLKQVITSIDNGSATPAEKKFYQKLITVFFCVQEPGIVNQFENDPKKFDKDIDKYNKVLTQDLNEFGVPPCTPH